MKKLLLGAAALIAFAAPAVAADIPARTYSKAPAYTAPAVVYNWTGFYIGGHVGGAFAGDNALQSSDARFMGGVQGGFDYQFAPNWVLGAEAQYSWLGGGYQQWRAVPGRHAGDRQQHRQLGSVTGRLGYTWGPALLYGKGGYAWRDSNNIGVTRGRCAGGVSPPAATARTAIPSAPASNTCSRRTGRPRPNTSITISATPRFTAGPPDIVGTRFRDDEHTVKVGLNYRFGWGGPVVSKILSQAGQYQGALHDHETRKGRPHAGLLFGDAVKPP